MLAQCLEHGRYSKLLVGIRKLENYLHRNGELAYDGEKKSGKRELSNEVKDFDNSRSINICGMNENLNKLAYLYHLQHNSKLGLEKVA